MSEKKMSARDSFIAECMDSMKDILADGKLDAHDIPEMISLVTTLYSNSDYMLNQGNAQTEFIDIIRAIIRKAEKDPTKRARLETSAIAAANLVFTALDVAAVGKKCCTIV